MNPVVVTTVTTSGLNLIPAYPEIVLLLAGSLVRSSTCSSATHAA